MADKDVEAAASAVAEAGKNLPTLQSPDFPDSLKSGFQNMKPSFSGDMSTAKDMLNQMNGMGADACEKVLPLLRFEIFRDFSQIIGVIFAGCFIDVSGPMKAAKDFFGGMASLITIDFGTAFQSDDAVVAGVIIAITLGVLTILSLIWLIACSGVDGMKMNAVRTGNETVEFSVAAEENKKTITFVNITLLIALSIYLPLTQAAFQIYFCDRSSFLISYFIGENGLCKTSGENGGENTPYDALLIFAHVVTVFFTLALPIFLVRQVKKHMPQGSPMNPNVTNDIDGVEVPFDDRIYNELVENNYEQNHNPFRSLYRGYERKWALWKVYILLFKLVLVIVVTGLSAQTGVDEATRAGNIGIASFIFMFLLAILTYCASPFFDPLNDVMDSCGRVTAVIASLAGIVNASAGANSGLSAVFGVLVMISSAVNMVVMFAIMFSGVQFVRNFVKNTFGLFTFYDSCKNLSDINGIYAIKYWQIDREVKHRVWQAFWNSVITNEVGEESARRLVRLQKDAVDFGIKYIENHWAGFDDPAVKKTRSALCNDYEGVDVYWPDATGTRDGVLDSETCFGKMYVTRYPFHCVVVYDDAEDESFIKDTEQLDKFIEWQKSLKITNIRECRKKLRGLADMHKKDEKKLISFPFERAESRRVPDGTEQYTNSKGETKSRTAYSNITINMHYTLCYVSITTENDKIEMACGYKLGFMYADGYGEARKPRTGEMYHEKNTKAEMDLTHVGFNNKFQFEDDNIDQKFKNFETAAKSSDCDPNTALASVAAYETDYRLTLEKSFEGDRHILSNAFWFYIYNNPKIERKQLEDFLTEREFNTYLKEYPTKNKEGLDFLYQRMAGITTTEKSKLWYVFFEDFYYQNKSMKIVDEWQWVLDPTNAEALCYKVVDRETLERYLGNIGMLKGCMKKYFTPEILDQLFHRIENPETYPLQAEAK